MKLNSKPFFSKYNNQLDKIVHIITRLDMGGSAQNTLGTCIGLSERGYQIVLVSGLSIESKMTEREILAVRADEERARKSGVKIIKIAPLIRKISPLKDTAALLALLKLIKENRPIIIHTHSSKAGILGRFAAWILRTPITIHTPHGHVFQGHFPPVISKVFLIIERLFDKITDCTVALTRGERDDYLKLSVTTSPKLATIHSGVKIKKFMHPAKDSAVDSKSLGVEPYDRIVGAVGWLLPIKGPDYLIKAMQRVWRKFPDVKLVFVGKGELKEKLMDMANDMGVINRVLFSGWRDDIHNIMPLFEIFVLPSLNEGMGRVIVEAMAAERPVVASNIGGIPDLVIDGETGILVEPCDVIGLADSIESLLENPDRGRLMGQFGRQRSKLFTEKQMVEQTDQLYQKLIQRDLKIYSRVSNSTQYQHFPDRPDGAAKE
ncbi:MAG: glycosyltransferase family 4 protein [Bacteroidetes bacterium]|nr:glycosyltransferase family 4 protein [Bacteroidota bacterium]